MQHGPTARIPLQMRQVRRLSGALIVLLCIASACAHLGLGGAPALLEEAKAAGKAKDMETAYARLKQIEIRYPGSPESREAFPLAAASLRVLYFQHRLNEPNSVWVTSEPDFLFDWFATYFRDGSPEAAANALFVGFDYGIFRRFEAFAKSRPDLAPWLLRAQDDNGIIEAVTVERRTPPAP